MRQVAAMHAAVAVHAASRPGQQSAPLSMTADWWCAGCSTAGQDVLRACQSLRVGAVRHGASPAHTQAGIGRSCVPLRNRAACKMFAPVLIFQIGQQAHLYVNDTERVGVLGDQ